MDSHKIFLDKGVFVIGAAIYAVMELDDEIGLRLASEIQEKIENFADRFDRLTQLEEE